MDKVFKRVTAVGLTTVTLILAASTTPNFGSAEQKASPLAYWMELPPSDTELLFPTSSHCRELGGVVGETDPVKVGVSYKFIEDHPSFLSRTADLIVNPSEAVAKRELYALDMRQLSHDSWQDVVHQASSDPSGNLRLSVIVSTELGYVGTPIKWEPSATDAIARSLEWSEQAGLEQNEIAVAYASGLVAGSLDSFSMAPASLVNGIDGNSWITSINCFGSSDQIGSDTDTDVYIGVSFQPAISDVAIKALTTSSGVGGERLGSEVPSWPYADLANNQ